MRKTERGAEQLSEQYFEALKDSHDLHKNSVRTFPGTLVYVHAPFIRDLARKHHCRTMLDYGCGKGHQYVRTHPPIGQPLEQYWHCGVTKYDPAYKRFREEPRGEFDIVICTQTLGSIPIVDLPLIIDRVYGFARKAVYIGEIIGQMKKRVFRNPELMPIGWSEEQWLEALNRPRAGLEVQAGFRYGDTIKVVRL